MFDDFFLCLERTSDNTYEPLQFESSLSKKHSLPVVRVLHAYSMKRCECEFEIKKKQVHHHPQPLRTKRRSYPNQTVHIEIQLPVIGARNGKCT